MLIAAANGGTGATGVNDPGDDIAMQTGIQLSQQYGENLTKTQLDAAITQTIDDIEAAQNAGADTGQVRYR